MKITESLKEYLTVDQNEWVMKDDYSRHILDYDGENALFESVISDADLEFLQQWTERNGQFPIIGRLISANSSGEHEWKFSNNGHANGGYHNNHIAVDDQGDVQESSDTFDCPYAYLFGNDLNTVKSTLLNILFHDCGVGVADETVLFGWLYIIDLSNAKSYYGNMNTIFPPNDAEGRGNDKGFYIENDHEEGFPDLKDLLASES
jgi:hypothetical protein